jgi:predicted phosphoribosyltransferase
MDVADRLLQDRRDAGRVLAGLLDRYRGRPAVLVPALPRRVPVGYKSRAAFGTPLDVFLVRKLGAPGKDELAMGAVAAGCPRPQ